jgi:hypothetical protein
MKESEIKLEELNTRYIINQFGKAKSQKMSSPNGKQSKDLFKLKRFNTFKITESKFLET